MTLTSFLVIAHIIGVVLGAGAATMSDLLFVRSMRRNEIQDAELRVFHFLSNIVWIGLFLLALSGFGFLLYYRIAVPDSGLIYRAKLLVKLFVTAVIFFNGLIMHVALMPTLSKAVNTPLNRSSFMRQARYFFVFGAISIVSWYTALILGAWRGLSASLLAIFGTYVAIVLFAAFVAYFFGPSLMRIITRQRK